MWTSSCACISVALNLSMRSQLRATWVDSVLSFRSGALSPIEFLSGLFKACELTLFAAWASLHQLWKVKGQAKGPRRFGSTGNLKRLASCRSRSLPAHYHLGQEQEALEVVGRKDEARDNLSRLASSIHSSVRRRTVLALQRPGERFCG